METLPVEMVERIVQQLTLQDLARCSAVCRKWREIFNQDWMWKPHCDPELEEPLRTIPCVATPAFVAPEAENPTLSPISHWKLAFLRESNLWKNWRRKQSTFYWNENALQIDWNDLVNLDFLSDTLVVVWCSKGIAILDVSIMPGSIVAVTDTSVEIDESDRCSVVGTTMLLIVEQLYSIQVFNIDLFNKTIKLKHKISLGTETYNAVVGQEHFCLCLADGGSKLKIFDLNTGMLLKEEPCPVKKTHNGKASIEKIRSSPTGDFVACQVVVQDNSNGNEYDYYIYSLKQLAFLPGPVAKSQDVSNSFELQGHWLAITDCETLKVYNFQTLDVLLSHEVDSDCNRVLIACDNSFIFTIWSLFEATPRSLLKSYSPVNRTLNTVCEIPGFHTFKTINNKFMAMFKDNECVSDSVWKLSDQMLEKRDVSLWNDCKINRSFTKVICEENCGPGNQEFYILNLW